MRSPGTTAITRWIVSPNRLLPTCACRWAVDRTPGSAAKAQYLRDHSDHINVWLA